MRQILVGTMIAAALMVAPRAAAAQSAAPDARMFAGALAGVSFGGSTGALVGGRFGYRIGKNLHLFAEVGRITDVTPGEVDDLIDEALEEIGDDVPVSIEAKFPATYFVGGVRWSKMGPRLSPFVEGGIGVGHISPDVHLTIAGLDFTDEVLDLIGEDLSVSKFLLMLAGGVNVSFTPSLSLDAGYRYTRIATEEPVVNTSAVYGMVIWAIK